ncbi:hypothetical protein DFJ63DRAFT_337590 [Scheffersomyces coipomensis]|uniref:uncharacterized protein n=1 Tax=Scheffersomyces coipomensis TaxID=1788519 RepID=UPI00315D2D02
MAGDLNLKKSWNPALMKNQKKIWQDEQDKLQEIKQIKQLQQEYHQENEYKSLLTLQYGEGFDKKDLNNNEKLKLNKLNWMYDDMPKKDDEEVEGENGFVDSNEEFLDGKNEVENLLNGNKSFSKSTKDKKSSSFANDNLNQILNVGKSITNSNNNIDDPLLKIKQERYQRQKPSPSLSSSHSHRSRESSSIRHKDDHRIHKESSSRHSSSSHSSSSHRSSSHRSSSHRHHHSNFY